MSSSTSPTQFIGLMSGTSLDGIDGVRVTFPSSGIEILQHEFVPYSTRLRAQFSTLLSPSKDEIHTSQVLAIEHSQLAHQVVGSLTKGVDNSSIAAIGNHGQTIRHRPDDAYPYSIQLGNGALLSQLSGLTTVMDFRSRDIAAGGQGAPLVPAFHQAIFYDSTERRAIVNIGGIANVSILNKAEEGQPLGFDTGPGNAVIDEWSRRHLNSHFDEGGQWAASGNVNQELLTTLLQDVYFHKPAPKSTGRDHFHLQWLEQHAVVNTLPPQDVQATLCELTAVSIINGIRQSANDTCSAIYLCGGGANNHTLVNAIHRLAKACSKTTVRTTETLGLNPQLVEACAFAWLAKQALAGLPGNSTLATGAREQVVLGCIYPA